MYDTALPNTPASARRMDIVEHDASGRKEYLLHVIILMIMMMIIITIIIILVFFACGVEGHYAKCFIRGFGYNFTNYNFAPRT